MQYFHILTNLLNYSGCGNVLPTHTIYMTSSTEVISDSNKVSNGPDSETKAQNVCKRPFISLG